MPFEIWNEQYLKGATVDDLIQTGLEHTSYFTEKDFDNSDLTFYKTPDIDEMKDKKIIFRWMSYYKKWTLKKIITMLLNTVSRLMMTVELLYLFKIC